MFLDVKVNTRCPFTAVLLLGDITVRMSWKKPSTDADESTKTFVLERGDEVSFSQSGYVRVAVTDSGAGMSDDQLAKVFGDCDCAGRGVVLSNIMAGLPVFVVCDLRPGSKDSRHDFVDVEAHNCIFIVVWFVRLA